MPARSFSSASNVKNEALHTCRHGATMGWESV